MKDQLLVRFEEPVDLQSVGIHAVGVRRIELMSGHWDQVFVTLEQPPEPLEGVSPPGTGLRLDAVEVLNVELTHLHDGGEPCIAELAFAGVPSRLAE